MSAQPSTPNAKQSNAAKQEYLDWLVERSMLLKHQQLVESFSGVRDQWRHPFADARHNTVLGQHSVWLAAYPDSLIGSEGQSVLEVLGSTDLLRTLSDIGVSGIHTGPMKLSGGIVGREYSSTVDGHFDRIESIIDPAYGTERQYQSMVDVAAANGIAMIGDLVPGHTGKGTDFLLALRRYPGFCGLYSLIEIRPDDWGLLPDTTMDSSTNLSVTQAESLRDKGYLPVGPLDIEVFTGGDDKETSWSATGVVEGVDGCERRWVYLHVFKQGQPSLNWLDPSFGAYRLIAADLLHSIEVLGISGVRLDATMFLGLEPKADSTTSRISGHPLSVSVTDTLGMLIRKFGGFSFQELNTDLRTLKRSMVSGPDLNYDFFSRPSLLLALACGDAGPLRLMLRELRSYGIPANRLVHALQNHDELMLEATHLAVFGDVEFEYEGRQILGRDLFQEIHERTIEATTGSETPYNFPFAHSPGLCTTLIGLFASRLKLSESTIVSRTELEDIVLMHLLGAAFNALQGGVFVVSGWDLVGALPLDEGTLTGQLSDGDYRWINRGAYDLIGLCHTADTSLQGLPKATALYGDIRSQLENPHSFVSRLRAMLAVRDRLRLQQSDIVEVPEVSNQSVVVLVNELESAATDKKLTVLALNFGSESSIESFSTEPAINCLEDVWTSRLDRINGNQSVSQGSVRIGLLPYEARLFLAS